MFTQPDNGLNAPRTVMWTLGQIAERDGTSKPAVSQQVKRLTEKHKLSVERDAQGRVALVNVAEYDHLRNRVGDPSKSQAPRQAPPPLPESETYDEALRQKTWHEAERKRLELAVMQGDLVRVATVAEAKRNAGAEIARVIDRLPNAADDLAAAVAREGAHGMRVALKKLANRLRSDIARALDAAALIEPPETVANS